MTIQLVGVGLGRTGTLSLKLALEQLLGGTCHHMFEVFAHPDEVAVWDAAMHDEPVDFPALLGGYCAIVDYPGAAVWRELTSAFPDVPVLLSTRSSAQVWWDSASSTIFPSTQRPASDAADDSQRHRAMIRAMFERNLGVPVDDADGVMAAYEAHNAAVRAEIAPERLFEYQPGDGWGPLCAALGLPEPAEPFPHTNTREEFRSNAGLD
ncbi:MAG TPA: sulfotransferase [Ilumatobacteraceae bacterium]|nr:sulfotransferase [Ilumatobacteraceae bacterium]